MWSVVILYQGWTHIKQLYLMRCRITYESIDSLLKVEWPNLTELILRDNYLGDAAVNKILQK